MAKDTGATLTSVQIKVTADTRSAQTSIKNLAEKLKGLKAAVGEGIQLPSAKKIEAFGTAMSELKNVKWTSIANGMNKVAEAMERMASITIDLSTFRAFAKAASKFGATDAGTKSTTQNAAQAMASNLPMAMGGAGGGAVAHPYGWMHFQPPAQTGTTAVGEALKFSQSTSKVIDGVWREVTDGATRAGDVVSGELNNDLQNTTKYVFDAVNAWDVWDDSIYRANAALIAFNTNASRLATVVSIMKKLASAIMFVLKVLKTFGSIVGKVALNFAKMTGSVAIAPWKKLGVSVGSVAKRLSGFLTALKRIAVYRAIRWALKELTNAFKEGMENLYQYSLLIDGQFYKSMDMLATSALYAKNSLAAMASPIVNALAPAVDMITDKFVDLLNTVNELVASLTGAETWTKALKYPTSYAEAADDANKKAKDLRATLLGFDEINRLDDNRRGSRGSAEEQLDYSKMFEEKTVNTKAKNFVKAIKDAFKKGDFTQIGETLGENLKKGLDSIKWDDVKASVERNASSVATLINGFINVPNLGTKIGETIAQVFNVAVAKMQMFFGTVKWEKVGAFLGDGINGILAKFDVAKLGQNLATIVNSAVNLIHGFTSRVKWSEFGSFVSNGINNFLATVKGKDIGKSIAGVVNSAVSFIHGFASDVKWSEVGKFISDGINGFFDDFDTNKLAETISKAIKGAADLVTTFFKETDFQKIGDKVGDIIKDLNWTSILSGLGSVLVEAIKSAVALAAGLISANPLFATAVGTAIAYKIAVALGATSVTTTIANAMGSSVEAGAVATGTGIAAGSSAIGIAAGVALGGLSAAAMLYVADKISNGESTKAVENALGISIRDAAQSAATGLTEEQRKGKAQVIMDRAYNKSLPYTTPYTYSYKAKGGDVTTGSLFVAGEAGAEIISSASGHTTVHNRDQIADSVAIGNEESNALLRQLVSIGNSLLAKDTTVVSTITTGQITSALNRANVRSGNTVVAIG